MKGEESKAPVEADSLTEKIKSLLYDTIDWQNSNIDFIDSQEKIDIGELIIPFDQRRGIMVCKGYLKDRNDQSISVSYQINY